MPTSVVAAAPSRGHLGRRLRTTGRARHALRDLVAANGPQHIIVSWPAGATTVPTAVHAISPYEAIIGHVASCPIYVDVRQLNLFRNLKALLDVPQPPLPYRRPLLRLHTERQSAAN